MSEYVSLITWPTIANYSLISLWFYVLCQKLQKCCNDISVLKRAYLYTHQFKSYELKSIRKPRRSTLLHLCNAKCDSYAVKCYITSNPKLPNIATLLEPTVATVPMQHSAFIALPPLWHFLKWKYLMWLECHVTLSLCIALIFSHLPIQVCQTHSSFCFPPVSIPHTAFYYPNPMAGALYGIYPSPHMAAPICHLLCYISSIASRPISLLWKGCLATWYLFQLSCLPQRLYVMTLILTSLLESSSCGSLFGHF